MKMVKSLVLGSAAGLLALSAGAQAADLPLKAKAVEYVKVCSLYGAGFYYIPGTDTCIKIGGYVFAETAIHSTAATMRPAWSGEWTRDSNDLLSRSRFGLQIDTRTATEYGVVRTYFNGTYTWTTNGSPRAGGELGVYHAFVQFAGFTFGKAVSVFSPPWNGGPGSNITSYLVGGDDTGTGVNQVAYTAQFGNGVSASIALEESSHVAGTAFDPINSYRRAPLYDLAGAAINLGANEWGGSNVPDIVGAIKLDQAWGMIQLSAAAHQLRAGELATGFAPPSDAWGFAVQGALSLKNLPTGPGDTINLSAGYTNGATRYLIGGVTGDSFSIWDGSFAALALSSDGVFMSGPGGFGIQKTTAWGLRGAFNHNWDPYWATSVFGSYTAVSYNDTVKAAVGNNPDFALSQIGVNVRWTPVKNLTFTGEALYTHIDQNLAAGTVVGAPVGGGVALAKDAGTWTFGVRAMRTF